MAQFPRWFVDQVIRWSSARSDHIGERMGLRVLSGRSPRLWYGGRRATVAAVDVDTDSGVAAVWLSRRVRWRDRVEQVCLYEHDGSGWLGVGGGQQMGGSGPKTDTRPVNALASEGGASARSYFDRVRRAPADHSFDEVGWVACHLFHTAASVAYLDVAGRRITVPAHGHAIVVWKSGPSLSPPARPVVAAVGQDRTRLAELRANDHFDSADV